VVGSPHRWHGGWYGIGLGCIPVPPQEGQPEAQHFCWMGLLQKPQDKIKLAGLPLLSLVVAVLCVSKLVRHLLQLLHLPTHSDAMISRMRLPL